MKISKILIGIFLLIISIFININYSFALLQNYSNLGYNVDLWVDRSRNHIFIDTIKQMRIFSKWSSTPQWEKANLWSDFFPIEDFGWVLMTGQKPGSIAWIYKWTMVLRNETTNLKIELVATPGTVQNILKNGKNVTFEFNIPVTADQLMFNIKNTNGWVSNIKILRPWYTSDSEMFTNEFLKAFSKSKILRTMEFTLANNSNEEKWQNRKSPLDPDQTWWIWVAWEYVIELANKTNQDIWINIPHKADDDYIRNLAQLFKQKLNPNLKIYLEYSNEVWNSLFTQAWYNYDTAEAEQNAWKYNYNYDGVNNKYYYGWRRTGLKTKQIWDIFREVFSTNDFSKIRPILWGQLARYEVQKTALKFLQDNYPDVNKYIYWVWYSLYLWFPDSSVTQTVYWVSLHINKELTKWMSALDDNSKFVKEYKLKMVAYEWWFESYNINLNKTLVSNYLNSDYVYTDLKKLLEMWKTKTNWWEFMYYFWWASNWSAWYNYWFTDSLYNTNISPRLKALNEYFSTPFEPISDTEWFKKSYSIKAPIKKLQINTVFTGTSVESKNIYKLESFSYWNWWFPFLDLMKSATVWTLWRGSDDRTSLDLDENWWVKSMKNIKTWEKIQLVRSILISNPSSFSGSNLVVYYDWEWDFNIFGCTFKPELSTDGKRVYSINPWAGNLSLQITDINPENYLRDIKIISSKNEQLFLSWKIFNPDFLNKISLSQTKALDFNNWLNLNKTISDTKKLESFNYPTWVSWVPFEVMVALINQTNFPWIFKLTSEFQKTYVDLLLEKIKKYKSEFIGIGVSHNWIRIY